MNENSNSGPLLELRDVRRVYGSPPNEIEALAGVDFSVGAGELVAVMGPSGSGKSTLLAIAGGLESPSSGSVSILGTALTDQTPASLAEIRRRHVGFVFQEFNLLPDLTASENVAAPLELDGLGRRRATAEAERRLGAVGLSSRLDAFPDDMSGGERQRVAIARALVGERRILLADEPTGSLDSETGGVILGLIRSATRNGIGAAIVTHDPVVASHADRVVRLLDGRIDSEPHGGGPELLADLVGGGGR